MKTLALALIFAGSVASAGVREVQVQVKGLVCAFCANGLKSTLLKNDAVDSVLISLEKRQVRVFVKDGRDLSDPEITQLVDEAGFKAEKIQRLEN